VLEAYTTPPEVKEVRPVPPFVVARVPASVTAPVVAVLGVNPVEPALKDATVPPVVAKVPLVGNVTFVAPVVVSVRAFAPDVASVEPLSSVNVPVVLLTVRPLREVAVAAPRTGVTSVGEVARTLFPEPVFVTDTTSLLAFKARAVEAVRADRVLVPETVRPLTDNVVPLKVIFAEPANAPLLLY
jgi:hypothetical protein